MPVTSIAQDSMPERKEVTARIEQIKREQASQERQAQQQRASRQEASPSR